MKRQDNSLTELQEELAATKKMAEMYRQLIQNINSAVLRMDREGKIIFLNLFGLTFFGFSEEELIGKSVIGTIVPEIESSGRDLRFMIQDIAVNPERYINNENENMRKNGERVWLSWTNKAVLDTDGKVVEILCVANDITERKKMEEELQVLVAIVKNSKEMINLATLDGQMTFLNDAGCQILGLTQDDVKKTHILDVIPDHLKDKVEKEILPLLTSNGCWQGELECQNVKNGNRTFIQTSTFAISDTISGEPKYLANISRDITDNKNAEEALRTSEERLRLAMEATKQGWFDLNIQTGEVVVSPEYPKILGYKPGELDASLQSWINGIHPEDRDAVLKVFHECLRSCATRMMEYRRITKTGEWKWILSIAQVIEFDHENKPLRMIGTHTDITERKCAEDALKHSEEKFNKAFRSNPAPMIISRLEDGSYIDVNESFLKSSGFAREEVIGRTSVELGILDRETRDTIRNMLVPKGALRNQEIRFKTKSGELRMGHLSVEIITIDEQDCMLIVAEDTTERDKAIEALEENVHFLQTLIDAIPTPIFYKDTELKYVGCNKAYEESIGIAKDQFIGKTPSDLFPEHLAELYARMDRALLENQQTQTYESIIRFSDGNDYQIIFYKAPYKNRRGSLAGLVGVIVDITERKATENQLRQAKSELEQIFDFLPDATFAINCKGEVIAWNKAIEEMTGVLKSEMLGKNNYEYALSFYGERRPILIDFILSELEEEHQKKYQDIKRTRDLLIAEAFVPNAYGGRGAYVSGRASPLYDTHENLIGAVETIRNITERKKAEELLLEEERVKTLGVIAAGIAHDINNQLTLLYGNTEMMLRNKFMQFVDSHFRAMIERIKSASETIQETVARLQNFYRPSLNLQSLDINKVAVTAAEITKLKWRNMLEKEGVKVKVNLDLAENLPRIMGSENEIKQMFINLILNAADSISDQGEITIRSFIRDDKIIIEVTDTGSGMSKEVKDKCLEPFFTTKGEGGTGIGLFSVRRSMNEHKGEIQIESDLGKGTTVRLVFPISNNKLKPTDKKPQKSIRPLAILLIDDDFDVRNMMAEMLKGEGHQVIKADGGQEGLSKFDPNFIELVITDLGMPEMSGYEVVEKLREISGVPIIVSTGFGDYLTQAETSRLSDFNCLILSKPAKATEIHSAIIKAMKL
jgi:PAS domain S-box-containing protein